MAIFPFEQGLGETTELSVIHDPIIRSLGSRAGAEIRCHEITIWLFTPLLVLYRYGEGRNGAFTVGCLRIGVLLNFQDAAINESSNKFGTVESALPVQSF